MFMDKMDLRVNMFVLGIKGYILVVENAHYYPKIIFKTYRISSIFSAFAKMVAPGKYLISNCL